MSTNHGTWGMSMSATFRMQAAKAATRAAEDLGSPKYASHVGRDGQPINYTPHAADAVIMAVNGLEAGINEMAVWVQFQFVRPVQPLPDCFERERLTDKWGHVSNSMVGRTLNAGAQPWQDFATLVGLRDLIVHSRWYHERVPRFMRALQARDLTLPEDPAIDWTHAALTTRVAAWAVDTSDRMFAAHAELLGQTDPAAWPWC